MVVSAVQVAKRALLATMRAAAAMFGLTILPVHILPDGWGCDLQMSTFDRKTIIYKKSPSPFWFLKLIICNPNSSN